MKNKYLIIVLSGILIGIFSGIVSYLFLKSLDVAIEIRKHYPWLILILPFAGAGVAWFYHQFGKDIEGGNNLVLDEIHEPQKKLPFKMVPMIFIASTISHLFGASVGREGAAVQMGAGIGDLFSKFFHEHRKIFLMMGMSAGFASIFSAPIAGTIFGLEVIAVGVLEVEALFPCMIAAVSGYIMASYFGVHQSLITPFELPVINLITILSTVIAAICFGLAARLFVWAVHYVKHFFTINLPSIIMRPFIGGIIIASCYYLFGSDRYHNLGEEIIRASFTEHVYPWDFLGKIWMTAVSVGAGFKGGEVMPLFYIGSTLGNALSYILPLTFPFLAGLGFVSVFAAAANAPIAGIFLAFEFFGSEIGIWAGVAIVVSYLFSGKRGIYSSQRGIK